MSPRADRSSVRGLRVAAGGGDLIEDIHRQQRRRVLKRAAQLTALFVALLLLGLGFKFVADRSARTKALSAAQERFVSGTVVDVSTAVEILEHSLAEDPKHAETLSARALARAHLWLEFGVGQQQARDAIAAAPAEDIGGALAAAVVAFADGDLETATQGASAIAELAVDEPLVAGELAWLQGLLAAATQSDDPAALGEAIEQIDDVLASQPQSVSHRRVRALLLLLAGDSEQALSELDRARDQSRSHMGLAADETLYNAYLHQELGGVGSVADQLLDPSVTGLSPRDRAHVQLARGVVHVRNGESKDALNRLDAAWDGLAPWNKLARVLAIESALEAADGGRVEAWLEDAPLSKTDAEIYRVWAVLISGDVMQALGTLAKLPQEHPRVGYLQALALVEQRRFKEAKPWLERTEKLIPGLPDVEVAAARVELRLADKEVALRKLKALAAEEAYAPRAFTGLGEAYLLQKDVDSNLRRKAQKAFEQAIKVEPHPAEAMLNLARIWDGKRKNDPQAEGKAISWMERAVKANAHLPRYREELALYLAELGYDKRARPLLAELVDEPGVDVRILMTLIPIEVDAGTDKEQLEPLLEAASKRGADARALARHRARYQLRDGTKESLLSAQQRLEALVNQDPADVESRALFAMTYLKQYDRKTAEAIVRRGFPVTPKEQHARLRFAWAEIEARAGKKNAAAHRSRVAWTMMLAENRPPKELLASAELATKVWIRQKKERVAMRIGRELTARLQSHGRAWEIRATAELAGGEAAAARESAERAIELDESNPRAHAIHGHSLLRFGRREQAREAYLRAIELVKGTPAEREYRDNLRRL